MNRVRGKKRMEIIKRFLEGEEDSDYEVVPTVTEGKYIVRPRKKQNTKRNKTSDTKEEVNEEVNEEEETTEVPEQSKPKHIKPKQSKPKQTIPKQTIPELRAEYNYQAPYASSRLRTEGLYYDPTVSYQILEQLKLLGEEQRNKRKKKEQKKLVKHQIQKQMSRARMKDTESEDEEYYEYEEHQEQHRQPQPRNEVAREQSSLELRRSEAAQRQYNLMSAPMRRKVNLLK